MNHQHTMRKFFLALAVLSTLTTCAPVQTIKIRFFARPKYDNAVGVFNVPADGSCHFLEEILGRTTTFMISGGSAKV